MSLLATNDTRTLIDRLLLEQRSLTAVDRYARLHGTNGAPAQAKYYRDLIPLHAPSHGEQYAFEVNLDQCSGCKGCVTACHSLNGLDEAETWRNVGLLLSPHRLDMRGRDLPPVPAVQQHITTACHHCVDPGCLNGCPVLAYDKDTVSGIVRHLDDQCIGCSYCIMKCPYEVPKYSHRLGIVRKCDMCANRLAASEAPACVQACPHEAIRITIVDASHITAQYRNGAPPISPERNVFLPDSPEPSITLPTTRYISRRPLPANLAAADRDALRLDHPHWPLILMLVLTQASAGMFLAALIAPTASAGRGALFVAGFAILNLGLAASLLHLGRPLKAWRAFLGWRTSWLSREIIAFNGFAASAVSALVHPAFAPFPAAMGLAAVFTSSMVYVDTRRPLWRGRITFGNFYGTALLLGAGAASFVFAAAGNIPAAQAFGAAALVIRTALFVWRRFEVHSAYRNADNPIHWNARVIRELLPSLTTLRTLLFVASTVFGLLAIGNAAAQAVLWAGLSLLTTLGSEVIARYVFFAAGAGKRMPAGTTS